VTGAALPMTWHHFFVAGTVLQTGGLEKSQNALARGRQPGFKPFPAPFPAFWLAASQPSGSATHRRLPSYAPFFSSLFQLFRGQGRPDALLCCTRIRQHPNAFGFNSVNHFKS